MTDAPAIPSAPRSLAASGAATAAGSSPVAPASLNASVVAYVPGAPPALTGAGRHVPAAQAQASAAGGS